MKSTFPRFPLELVVRSAGRQLARCLLKKGKYGIGQHEANDIEIDEPSISGRHARLSMVSETELYLEDLRSANGTFIDGQPVETLQRISFTSFIQLGNATLEFQRGGLPAAIFDYLPESFLHPRRYQLGGIVARGGVSTIVAARDLALERPVAVRAMQPACQRSPATVIRFIREAQIMGQLQHPNIPPVHELRMNDDGQLHYTTRLIEGESLGAILDRLSRAEPAALERWTLPALLCLWQKAADALSYAHAHGVIHCAVRPENVIAGAFGEVYVIGWTFAALAAAEDHELPAGTARVVAPGEASVATLTPFTPPELALGTGIFDERADIYSLGALLYALLAWKAPFPEGEERHLARQIVAGEIIPPPLVPPYGPEICGDEKIREGLREVALGALATSAGTRPFTVAQLQAQVAGWQNGTAPMTATRRWKGR